MIKPESLLSSGRYIDLLRPDVELLTPHVIAHSLSLQCRFNGQCNRFYSVAEHSVHVSYLCPPHLAMEGLMHDATEAVYGDIIMPLKQLFPEFKAMEQRLHSAINKKYCYYSTINPEIHVADMQMLALERKNLMPRTTDEWDCLVGIEIPDIMLRCLEPRQAFNLFLARYYEILTDQILCLHTSPCSNTKKPLQTS